MKHFATVNIERLDNLRLLVANIHAEESGALVNQIIVEYEGITAALLTLIDADVSHVLTSDRSLYAKILADSQMSAELKHKSVTTDTASAVETNAEILRELYGTEKDEPETHKQPSVWRIWLASHLQKITNIIGGIKQ
ncbi:hypothetical protein [Sporosarcina aquimarina]|uniref:Uncharacterized protein n=1 Tax=Sporosarcina aquimarina TaxID=114975 RepID=A0ABU4G0F6_9BACL|nr:hypothetical protein [Sporosarcina aquimarina]MDW0110454.1 hypothetical protein [Sporosarcina aquimarina]